MTILTLNAGSSSVKFALYQLGNREQRSASGMIERIGLPDGRFRAMNNSETLVDEPGSFPDHEAALAVLFAWLRSISGGIAISAIGHRVVQGGPRLTRPALVTAPILTELKSFIPLAPNHLPGAIAAIEAAERAYPTLPQVVCFDTAFHSSMPAIAQRLPLPREYFDKGVQRYGFHGLSYEYLAMELARIAPREVAGRVVIAHLGNGASMAAVQGGKAVDTTMGLTPLGGLVMSTRAGDLDPGVVLYLLRDAGLSVDQAEDLLAKKSGLLGVSGVSSDMKDLLERQAADPHAAEAVEIFCRQARKFAAAMTASLGGIDTLIFTGGIGEHAAEVRQRIAGGLGFLGVTLDAARNAASAEVISSDASKVVVRVMKTNEEVMIARQTLALLPSS
ncbi:MAG: acetate/propionate family kinase [Planctomycetota bacterium]